jgi:hypothetical protein
VYAWLAIWLCYHIELLLQILQVTLIQGAQSQFFHLVSIIVINRPGLVLTEYHRSLSRAIFHYLWMTSAER